MADKEKKGIDIRNTEFFYNRKAIDSLTIQTYASVRVIMKTQAEILSKLRDTDEEAAEIFESLSDDVISEIESIVEHDPNFDYQELED